MITMLHECCCETHLRKERLDTFRHGGTTC
jgi:hypothetical protein